MSIKYFLSIYIAFLERQIVIFAIYNVFFLLKNTLLPHRFYSEHLTFFNTYFLLCSNTNNLTVE